MDLNGDGFNDLRIASLLSGESGDLLTCVFLYNPDLKILKLNSSYGKDNVEFDRENKFIRSWLRGTKGQCSMKWKCLLSGNKLITDSTVAFCISQEDDKTAKLEFYKYGNSASNPPIKTIEGKKDSLWIIFSKTFWDSSDNLKMNQ